MAQALVPLKDLVQAKSRLAGMMNPSERRALAQAMFEYVLIVLCNHPQLQRVTLVSDDPGASLLAENYGADYIAESELGCRGLNQVITAACDRLRQCAAEPLLVLHGDLPLLSAPDVSAVLALQAVRGGLVIGCDRHRRGSNLLAFNWASQPRFCFGVDSCEAHCRSAEASGVASQVLYRQGIALDVDEARDMLQLMHALADAGIHTATLLQNTELGNRISLALSALEGLPEQDSQHYE